MSKIPIDNYAIDQYKEIENRIMNLAINRFSWEGLPEGLESRDIELMLIKHGQLFAFNHPVLGLTILPCFGTSDLNIYHKATKYNVFGNRYNKTFDIDNGVLIRNNGLGSQEFTIISNFATRINNIEQTQDVNLFQQNIPYIIASEQKEQLTARTIIEQLKQFKLVLWVKKGLSLKASEVLNTEAPFLLDKLQAHKTNIMNELLTMLGINNTNNEKRERLVVDEVNANNDFILVNIDHMYDERKKSAEMINKKFGTNIVVEKREVQVDYEDIYDNGTPRE